MRISESLFTVFITNIPRKCISGKLLPRLLYMKQLVITLMAIKMQFKHNLLQIKIPVECSLKKNTHWVNFLHLNTDKNPINSTTFQIQWIIKLMIADFYYYNDFKH